MIAKAYLCGGGVVLLLVLLTNGCTTAPTATPSPQVSLAWSIDQRYDLNPNNPITANLDINTIDVNEVLNIEVAILPLHVMPDRLLAPAGPYIRTMTLNPNPQLVTPVLHYSEGIRMGPVDDAETFVREIQKAGYGRVQLLQQIHGVLPLDIRWQADVTEPIHHERLTLQITRPESPDGKSECVLSHTVQEGSTPITERILFRDGLLAESPCWAMVMPCHNPTPSIKAIALIARIWLPPQVPEDTSVYQEALDRCLEQIQSQASQLSRLNAPPMDPWHDALELLRWPARHRKTLRYITQQSPFAHELVLAGPRPMIRSLAETLIVADDQGLFPHDQIPWTLEQMAYNVVVQSWEAGDLTPEVQALLTIHTGQVGRDLNTLKNVLQQASGLQNFTDHLIQENRYYLSDISPAARVRAYQWLEQQQAAPANYDPLGPAQERRIALSESTVTSPSFQESSLGR